MVNSQQSKEMYDKRVGLITASTECKVVNCLKEMVISYKILAFIQKKQQFLFQQIYNIMSNNQKALELLDKLISKLEANVESPEIKPAEEPKVEAKVEAPKEQVKEETKQAQPVVEKKEPKKKKGGENAKQNKKQQPEKPKLPPGADEDILAFSECDLRVSEIVECWKHPESTYLYCEKILVGKELREIASGLQEYIPIEQMKGKVIVFANLKPRPLGGFNSNGMVICSSNQPQNQFDLLCPEGPLGERLYLEGFEELFQTGEEILPVIKKKTLEKCKQHFSTDADGYVIWKGIKLRTKAGPVRSKITNGLVD